jgi:hypothetical protein
MLELEGTVKRWDEVRAEIERLEALIARYGCNPLPRPSPCRERHGSGLRQISMFRSLQGIACENDR